MDKKRILQLRIKQNINNKKKNQFKWNFISMDMKTINWYTCVNVLNNKKVSIIKIKARYIIIDFWRYFPSIRYIMVFQNFLYQYCTCMYITIHLHVPVYCKTEINVRVKKNKTINPRYFLF